MSRLPAAAFICALARQSAAGLPSTLARIQELRECFESSNVLFITNDSTDATPDMLRQWKASSEGVEVLGLDGLATSIKARTDRLAAARNLGLHHLRQAMESGARFDLMVVIDTDGINSQLVTGDTFVKALASAPQDWVALFGNQRQAYYDIWALRHRKWCPGDCWQDAQRAAQYYPPPFRRRAFAKAAKRFVGERQVRIPPGTDPISVDSAFGGIGIYRSAALSGVWYCGRDAAGLEACEHVSLNRGLREAGGRLYILPALLNDAPSEHLVAGSGATGRPWL
jgi:hypothetical protein